MLARAQWWSPSRSGADVGPEVLAGEGGAGSDEVGGCALEDDPAAVVAGAVVGLLRREERHFSAAISAPGTVSAGTQFDELDRAVGVLLVPVVATAGVAVHQRPKPHVVGMFGADHLSAAVEPTAANLDLDRPIRFDVVEPSWRSVSAAVRCRDDQCAIVVLGVDQRGCSSTPGATTGRGEQQGRDTDQPMSDGAPRRLVDRLMNAQEARLNGAEGGHGCTVDLSGATATRHQFDESGHVSGANSRVTHSHVAELSSRAASCETEPSDHTRSAL